MSKCWFSFNVLKIGSIVGMIIKNVLVLDLLRCISDVIRIILINSFFGLLLYNFSVVLIIGLNIFVLFIKLKNKIVNMNIIVIGVMLMRLFVI